MVVKQLGRFSVLLSSLPTRSTTFTARHSSALEMPRPRKRQAYTVEIEVLNDEGEFVQYMQPQAPDTAQIGQDDSDDGHGMEVDHVMEPFTEEFQLSLSRHFGSVENCIMLHKSQDGREIHFLTPQYDLDTCSIQPLRYGFLGLRWVKVAGGEHLVSFCRNPSCDTPADDGSLYEAADFARSPVEVLFGEQSTLCTCARALLEAVGGEAALKSEVQSRGIWALTSAAWDTLSRSFRLEAASEIGAL